MRQLHSASGCFLPFEAKADHAVEWSGIGRREYASDFGVFRQIAGRALPKNQGIELVSKRVDVGAGGNAPVY